MTGSAAAAVSATGPQVVRASAPATVRRPNQPIWLVGVLWLSLLAFLIWHHAQASVWPPIYDAYTYFVKSKFVWAALDAHVFGFHRLMAIEPSFRPIGTVLMSYPFGFTMDFRGFYFRSTFLPVALVCIAGFVGSCSPQPSRRSSLTAALTACFLSTLSLFFYFELYTGGPPPVSHWGLVDGFLTGLASLAMAAGTRSILRRSMGWACFAMLVLLAVIFVKPSGLLIAAVCGVVIGLGWLWRIREDWPTPRRRETLRQAAVIYIVAAIALGGGAFLAFDSAYLSANNLMYGNAAIDVMRAELQIDWRTQLRIAKEGLGPFVLVWVIAMGGMWVDVHLRRSIVVDGSRKRIGDLLLVLGLVILLGGVWFWIYGSGGRTLVRYFAPFLYVAIFCALPSLLDALDAAPKVVRGAIGILMAGTMVNLVLLLALPDPALDWQRQSGVNVKSGTRPDSIAQAEALYATPPTTEDETESIYSMVDGIADAMFESVFDRHALETAVPRYRVQRPVDWQRPTAYRVEEILSSNYILVDLALVRASIPLRSTSVSDERIAFNTWANGLTREDGIERMSASHDCVLLRIVDHAALRASLEPFVAAHQWRDVFVAENVARWWSDDEIRQESTVGTTWLDDIDFGGLVDMRRVMVSPAGEGAMQLKIWLRPTHLKGEGWVMLVHIVDDAGKITANHDIALGRFERGAVDKPYQLFQVKFVPSARIRAVAVGFYQGDTLLKASKGDTDWGGLRLLVKLPRPAP